MTIRGNGLSQSGQAIPVAGGLSLDLKEFNKVLDREPEAIWVETNSCWADLLAVSLKTGLIPYVLPYNCNLSIGGVISAAGIGASSFKFGPISAHVKALEVILADGEIKIVDEQSPLFKACLSGQGRFAVISKACIRLRPCLKQVKTFFLVYLDKASWLNDLVELKEKADYIEAFCSPSLQGMKLVAGKRKPFAQWLFVIHASVEYENNSPQFTEIFPGVHPWQLIHSQDESIHSYLHRHDPRFEAMKLTGQWELAHPWYECFMTKAMLSDNLDELLAELPIHYASLLQVVPLANLQQTGFFMLPEVRDVYELMILNPGINPVFVPSCLQVIDALDEKFLKQGGKRYLSGYLGTCLRAEYWQRHFGPLYRDWVELKESYDKQNIFRSFLHSP